MKLASSFGRPSGTERNLLARNVGNCHFFAKIDFGIIQCTPLRISTTLDTRQSPTIEVVNRPLRATLALPSVPLGNSQFHARRFSCLLSSPRRIPEKPRAPGPP